MLASAAVSLLCTVAHAQPVANFPERPVRIIVPHAPGATADRLARRFVEPLAAVWKQEVTLENRPGMARLLPAELTARPTNDGHVLLVVSAELFELRSDAAGSSPASIARSLQPIILLARAPLVLTADRASRLDSIDALRKTAEARPRALVLRTGANGTLERLVAAHLARMLAVSIDPRPRRDLPGFLDAAVDLELAPLPALLAAINAGTSTPLLLLGSQRAPILRAIPTAAERGLAAIEMEQWIGVAAGPGLLSERLTRLHSDLALTLATQDVHDGLIDEGFVPVGSSPAEFAMVLAREEMRLHAWVRGVAAK